MGPTNRAERRALTRSRSIAYANANAASVLDLPLMPAPKRHTMNAAWNDDRLGGERSRIEQQKPTLNARAATAFENIFKTDISALYDSSEVMHAQA